MLELIDVSIAYGDACVVSNASFEILPGEIVALTGDNGCGKSTLGKAMCAMRLVDEGVVRVDGHDPSASELERLVVRELVGYVQQDPKDQIVSALVYDEVAFGPRNLGLDESEVAERVRASLSAVELEGFDQRVTSELSGGEQQRLALAGVLAMSPRYLVLDEPTSQLDPSTREEFRGLFERLAKDSGIGIALITHDASEIALADRVVDCGEFRLIDQSCEHRVPADLGPMLNGCAPHSQAGTARALDLEHVDYAFDGRDVLRDATLSMSAGELVVLTGRSGAGKSTLASIAAGLVAPDGGTVRVCGAPAVPGSVGIAFQQPEGQFFLDSVYDEIAFAPCCEGLGEEDVRARVLSAADSMGLSREMLSRSPFELSGGQARRVALASVISLDAPVVIFDEPSAELDAPGRMFARDLASSLARAGRAVMVITHDIEEWESVADRVLALDGGTLRDTSLLVDSEPDAARMAEHAPVARSRGAQRRSGPFGGYVPSSMLAGVDARVKIVLLLIATVGLFVISAPWAWAAWSLCLACALGAARMRPADVLLGVRPVAAILAFTLVANLISCDGRGACELVGPVGIDFAGGARGLAAVGRIMMLVGFSLVVSTSTTGTQISDAVIRLLRPTARFGVPVAALGTVLSLALRFIPLVTEELGRIRLAQSARGARFDEGGIAGRIRAWGSVLTPLMVGLFRRSDRLAESMAARCYDAAGSGRMPAPRPLGRIDCALLVGASIVMGALIAASLVGLGR